ncbi:Nucleic-acid-binding protein from transposon X-element [Araneus ventricosus]|uniref:Nucleic-acid-binding protein from transposon X-element n=1 Tax=Araneus ventricosus TaxID=182803 RepID=A0A4Y2CJT8_ARAVE|nr:Nucleic-acid-binding protein from transposon X-element [Araneus ventricosus]
MHDKVTSFCRTQGYDFYVIPPRNKRPVKAVVKDLPYDYDVNKIKTFLIDNHGFSVIKVTQLTQFKTRRPLPFYLVELNKTENAQSIFAINSINHFKVTVEPFRGRNLVSQCFKCNYYHHTAGFCESKPRCLKCSQSHETKNCEIKTRIEKPTCINCGKEGHVASYRGREKFPKVNSARQNRQNYFSNGTKFHANQYKIQDNISYARISDPSPRQEMAPPAPHYEAVNETNYESSTNLFKDMLEGLAELKKLLREYPNLFTALKKLKNANDIITKCNILMEAFSTPGTNSSG